MQANAPHVICKLIWLLVLAGATAFAQQCSASEMPRASLTASVLICKSVRCDEVMRYLLRTYAKLALVQVCCLSRNHQDSWPVIHLVQMVPMHAACKQK